MVLPSVGPGNGLVAIKHLPEGTTTTIPCQIVSPGLSELKSEAHHNCKSHHEYREEFASIIYSLPMNHIYEVVMKISQSNAII